jgi:hypothetical protein
MNKGIAAFFAAIIISATAATFSPPAMAGGLIGDLVEGACGGCGAGRALDQAHKQIGRPLDHAAAGVARSYGVPLSPYCATPAGIFVGPFQPIGIPCNVNGMIGIVQ